MKKTYLQPTTKVSVVEVDSAYLLGTSTTPADPDIPVEAKPRDYAPETEDNTFGDLW